MHHENLKMDTIFFTTFRYIKCAMPMLSKSFQKILPNLENMFFTDYTNDDEDILEKISSFERFKYEHSRKLDGQTKDFDLI